jgi:hypothetical protein
MKLVVPAGHAKHRSVVARDVTCCVPHSGYSPLSVGNRVPHVQLTRRRRLRIPFPDQGPYKPWLAIMWYGLRPSGRGPIVAPSSPPGAITHTYELEGRTSVRSDALFSPTFMHHHTQFDSFEAFCTACPSEGDELHDLQRISDDTLDAFVSDATDFESWDGMVRSAAISNVMDLVGGQTPLPEES